MTTKANTKFCCLPTAIGSLPHRKLDEAYSLVSHYLKEIPAWPQLPNLDDNENMAIQFSEGIPGLVRDDGRIYVDRSRDFSKSLEELYSAYIENDIEKFPISQNHAAGLHRLTALKDLSPTAVKGQITGPITLGLTIKDEKGQSIIYDDILADAIAKLLKLKAAWQEKQLNKISEDTIIFVDEPYLGSFGSAFIPISKEQVITLLEEVFSGIKGQKGIHCCGNTDWSMLLETSVDVVSYDTYTYPASLSLYPNEVKRFLNRGGTIAWGIIPIDTDNINKETVPELLVRFEKALSLFTQNGISHKQLIEQGLLTPSCALAPLADNKAAKRALQLLTELSKEIRESFSRNL